MDLNDSFIFKESPEKEREPDVQTKDECVQASEFLNTGILKEKEEALSELAAKYNEAIKEVARLQE